MFGYSHDELINQPSRQLYCDDASFDAIGEAAYAQLSKGEHFRQQLQMRRKGGDKIWVDISGFMVSPESGESMWMMTDITALKAHQSQIEHLAFHDALTGLPNRRLLADRMAQGVVLCERLKCQMLVCFLDLDCFKAVNDLHGHDAGDLLLKEIARRLQSCVRASDTVARLGGDEFVLLLTPLDMLDEGRAVTQRVIEAVAMPVVLGPSQVAQVTASIGLASFPEDGREPASLLQQADAAMYQRKRQVAQPGGRQRRGWPLSLRPPPRALWAPGWWCPANRANRANHGTPCAMQTPGPAHTSPNRPAAAPIAINHTGLSLLRSDNNTVSKTRPIAAGTCRCGAASTQPVAISRPMVIGVRPAVNARMPRERAWRWP